MLLLKLSARQMGNRGRRGHWRWRPRWSQADGETGQHQRSKAELNRGAGGDPEDRGGDGVTEDVGSARGKEEPDRASGTEGRGDLGRLLAQLWVYRLVHVSGNCSVLRDDGWLVSGLGVRLEISFSAGQTEKYSPQKHPLHESGTPLRAIHGQARMVPLAEAGLIENTQRAVHGGGEICQFYEVSCVVLEGAVSLLHSEELDSRDIHPGKN